MFNFICIQSVALQLICQNCQIDQSTPSRFSVVNRCMLADIYKKFKCQNVDRSTTDKLYANSRTMSRVVRWSIQRLFQLNKSAIVAEKIKTWPDGHKIGRPTTKRDRSRQQLNRISPELYNFCLTHS